jgi:dihydroorotate dehydrogenase
MADLMFKLARPVLNALDPERAHGMTIAALKLGFARPLRPESDDPILATKVWNLAFPNPVGLAAGFDKGAEVCDAVLSLGFGFVEAGTVTPQPQPGNPGKRLYRLAEDEAVINRFGFNSRGLAPFAANLARRRDQGATGTVGANVGKNRDTIDAAADYVAGIEAVARLADYLVVNISSPNTPGLRALQARGEIEALLARVVEARRRACSSPQAGGQLHVGTAWPTPHPGSPSAIRPSPSRGGCQQIAPPPPLLAKVGPDLDDGALRHIAQVARALRIDGLIVGNTTLARPASLSSADRDAPGGLSGRPLFVPSTACLAAMYRFTEGAIPIVGCGGIASGADAYAKIRAGASLVQLYSALVFQGPALVDRIKRELAAALRRDGFASVRDAVGADHR